MNAPLRADPGRRPFLAGLLLACLMASPAAVRATSRTPGPVARADTGDLRLSAAYTADLMGVVAGGVDPGVVALDNLDVQLRVDGESLLGVPGLSAFVYGLANQGGSPSAHAGDLQVLDNIDAPTSWRIYEAWVQQYLAGDRLSLLAGLYDVNSEFDAVGSADLFLNSSFGIEPALGQSGVNGPSIFPVTSLALRARALLGQGWRVQAVAADGVPGNPADPGGTKIHLGGGDGALLVAEVGYLRPTVMGLGPGASSSTVRRRRAGRTVEEAPHDLEIGVGVWRYTGQVPEPAGAPPGSPTPAGGNGAYVIGEARLRSPGADGSGQLWAFGMLGIAQERASLASSSVVLGVSGTGLIPGRPVDRFGVGVAAARRSRRLTGAGPGWPSWEVTGEASYNLRLGGSIAVQPDLQLVHHPAAAPSVPDALVLGMRFEADL